MSHEALAGWSTAGERRALASWPRQRHRAVDTALWPAALASSNHVCWSTNDLKAVVEADGCVHLKAYLGVAWGTIRPAPDLW